MRLVWAIALPAMLTNIATALFGLADMWTIGRLADAPAQAAVELGAKYMMGLLNVFNFLRSGTVALTAQAAGRGDAAARLALLPLAGFASFVLDGVFVGAGWTRAMLGTMIAAMLAYVGSLQLLAPLGNSGLWIAFAVFFVIRAAGQLAILPRLAARDLH